MREDYIQKADQNAERRFSSPDIQIRQEEDQNVIEGIAAVVSQETDLGMFREEIAPGAFDDVLRDDVVALFNHDPNLPLARTTADGEGKLELYTTKRGDLGYRFTAPDTTIGRDLIENIRQKIIKSSSFAFTISEEKWVRGEEGEPNLRVIEKIKRLYDVAPVTYPAYPQTSVAARSMQKFEVDSDEVKKDKILRDKELRELDI